MLKTQWLKNPITDNSNYVSSASNLELKPYYGPKRKMSLRYSSYTIGSDPRADIFLNDPFLSKQHARLYLDGGIYILEDKSSKNGSYLNGTRIYKAILPKRASIRLGRSFIEVEAEEEKEEKKMFPEHVVLKSPLMKTILEEAKSAASSGVSILILGETGTGKDVLANAIHHWSQRSGPFVPISAVTASSSLLDSELFGHKKGAYTGSVKSRKGALLAAHRGTLFLDEVGDLPSLVQTKLLRSLETGEVKALGADSSQFSTFRLLSATSRDLENEVREGKFRLDFYYRISGIVLRIPPLRDRKEEIIAIAEKIVKEHALFLEPACRIKLLSHYWPGNIRELLTVIRRAVLLAKHRKLNTVLEDCIDFPLRAKEMRFLGKNSMYSIREMEKLLIQKVLLRTGWSQVRAAQELGIARSTLFAKIKRYSLETRNLI